MKLLETVARLPMVVPEAAALMGVSTSRLQSGVLGGLSPRLIEPGRLTVAQLLKDNGYHTACVGKWHLGMEWPLLPGAPKFGDGIEKGLEAGVVDFTQPIRRGPNAVGFDYYFGIPASLDMPPYVFVENERVTEAPTARIDDSAMRRHGGKGFWRAGAIAPGFRHRDVLPKIADKALAWLGKQSKDKPFFLYFALTAPHTPWLPTPEYEGKSGAGPYGDFVAQVDAVVGRVLRALDDAKLADDTLVVFTSDNGAHWLPSDIAKWKHRANDGLRGQKSDIWDGGHRVPFLARWPGHVPAGRTSNELICLTRNDGKVRWLRVLPSYQNEKKKGGPISWAGPVLGGDRLIVLASDGGALSISPYTGEPLGREQMSAGGYFGPVIADNSLYVLTDDARLSAYR